MATLIDVVVDKAKKDLWQKPGQDRRAVFNAVPVTGARGVKGSLTIGHNEYYMPDSENAYVVYDLGQLNPNLYGFDTFNLDWVSTLDVCNQEEMYLQILVNNRKLPAKYCYIMRTEFRTTLIAVRRDKAFGLVDVPVNASISFYSNFWYNTPDGALTNGIEAYAFDITSNSAAGFAYARYDLIKANPASNELIFVNGLYKPVVMAADFEVGDYVEIFEDFSGTGYYDIKLSSAPFFKSNLDNKSKYLLLAPDGTDNEKFMYRDDINIMLYNNTTGASGNPIKQGVVYDLFNGSDIRMVTHRDHSIDSIRIKNIIKNQGTDVSQANLYARVFTRNADVAKLLPDDGQYIKDLYLFNREERKSFMVGTNAVIDQWKAANLEESAFALWMGWTQFELSYDKAKNVYSSHGLTTMADTVVKNGLSYDLPPMAYNGGLIIQYDINMTMVGTETITSAVGISGTYPLPAGVEYIEFIPGIQATSGNSLEKSVTNTDAQGLFAEQYFYKDNLDKWLRADYGTHYTYDSNYNVVWKPSYIAAAKLKRDSGVYYRRDEIIKNGDICKLFDIFTSNEPTIKERTARVDIWVNGRKLTPDLDYDVVWPQVRVHNVEYLVKYNDVMIIAHGLPRDYEDVPFDFIKYGNVNYDRRFHLDFIRPIDMSIDGFIGVKDQVSFSERRTTVTNPLYREGAPYIIRKALDHVPIIYRHDLTLTKSQGDTITSKIEDYITTLKKETIDPVITTITNKHEVMSYVLNAVLIDLSNDDLDLINDNLSPSGVASKMLKYKSLIDTDPGRRDWDWNYILLAAHNDTSSVGVSTLGYAFMERVNDIYFNGRCQLNNYLHIV